VPEPPPDGFSRTWLARYEEGRRQGTREAFAVLDANDGTFLGIAVAPKIDAPARTLELGYAMAPGARGRGVATATLRWLTAWAFETHGARRLELIIGVANEASKAVARRCGYQKEGVLRSLHLKQEIWEDAEIWSRISTDVG
jgi:RimJ/RimL family protein N-acetyltransferase